MRILFYLIILSALCPRANAQQNRISLSGPWQYRLDPENKGIEDEWYNEVFEETLMLPGTLDDAGIGREPTLSAEQMNREVMLHLTRKHRYVGVAWYRREIVIPAAWKAKQTRLFLERVIWETSLWIDGKKAGSRESLNTPHQYDLGTMLSPGKHVLVIRVDNRKQYDISHRNMAHAYTDETQIMWNGIVGEMYLEALPETHISSLQVFSDVSRRSVSVVLALENFSDKNINAGLLLTIFSEGKAVESKEVKILLPPGSTEERVELALGTEAKLWDEFNPHLYTLKADLKPDGAGPFAPVAATQEAGTEGAAVATFGLRELQTEGNKLLLNGSRLFLRGTLECSIFPLTGHPPTDKEGWLKVFSTARSYGLNHLRFHSWCPPEAAFDLADSLGFYLQAELPLWITTFGEDTAAVRFIREEAGRMIEAYGNHPSFCFWSLGNELQGDFDLLKTILLELKEEDPRHLYTTTTFTFQKGHGGWPEEQDDFFVSQKTKKGWVRGQGIFNDLYPDFETDYAEAIDGIPVPIITHEIGQYSVYPDMDEIKKYTGVLEPLNFKAVREDLERKNLLQYADEFTRASGELSVLLYKEEIERALKTKGLSGFQLLDLHDFPGQGTALVGILDAFWDSKGLIQPEEFRQFCAPVVPLLRYPKAVYTNREQFEASVDLANYSRKNLDNLQVEWKISRWEEALISDRQKGARQQTETLPQSGEKTSEKKEIASGRFNLTAAPDGSLTSIGTISTSLSEIEKACKLEIEITLPGTAFKNSWNIWVYPEKLPAIEGKAVFTRSPEEALKLLAEGKKVLLNPDTSRINGVEGRFTQVFWSPVHFPDQPGTMGILCDPSHPAFASFPTDLHTNWQWWDLIMRSKTMIIDSLPPQEPLVRVIDNFFKNRKMALVLEAKVGAGSLLICSADIASELEKRPVARQLKHSLLEYMNSKAFKPGNELSETALKTLFQ